MGTPEFAVPSLELLKKSGYNICAVVTAPDKPSGRGQLINYSPVKEFAIKANIPVFQPVNLKSEEFVTRLKKLKPDILVVVAFRMLPEVIWKIPHLGTFNLHASLLPQYRGAAPINWAIIKGEKETGLTTFFIDEQIDTGKILFQERITIGDEECAGDLHDRLKVTGAQLVLKTVEAITQQTARPVDQNPTRDGLGVLKTAPRLTKEDSRINWNKNQDEIHNLIRGLSPHPGAFSVFVSPQGKKYIVKIYKTQKSEVVFADLLAGMQKSRFIRIIDNHQIMVPCRNGFIELIELQLEGRRRMKTNEFLRGFSIDDEWQIE